jgi:hypothetical protein
VKRIARLQWAMAALALSFGCAQAATVTVTHQNSSLKYTTDGPGFTPPVHLPRTLEWTVDGRRILVYPAGTSSMLDIGHLHAGLHVLANQMHGQGPFLGFPVGAPTGAVLGGVVYSLHGGTANSGASRMSEKVDIHNQTGAAVSIALTGMGYKSPQAALEVPDFSGLEVTGTTVVFFQGDAQTNSFTESPFSPVTVLPVVSFTGFNPLLNQAFSLPAGARLTMITELKVTRSAPLLVATWVWILVALVLAGSAGVWFLKRRDSDR